MSIYESSDKLPELPAHIAEYSVLSGSIAGMTS
jgi:hypothetical protein